MNRVSGHRGPIALVLSGVRSDGLPHRRYRTVSTKQFAVTIAISHRISGCQLADAVASVGREIAEGSSRAKDALARGIERAFGWLFGPFQSFLQSQFGSLSRHGGGAL